MSSNTFFRFWGYFFLMFITIPPIAALVLGYEFALALKGTPILLITAISVFVFGMFLTHMLASQFMLFFTLLLTASCLLLEYIFILRIEGMLQHSVVSLSAIYVALSLLSAYVTAGICYGLHFVCIPNDVQQKTSK